MTLSENFEYVGVSLRDLLFINYLCSYMSGDSGNLRLLLNHLRLQTSDGLLEIVVLGGVDERVDTAVAGA